MGGEYLNRESACSEVADALVVLGGGERPLHGKVGHGRTQSVQENFCRTRGVGAQEPTSLWGIARWETRSFVTEASPTEESLVREHCTQGSVRGESGNRLSYRVGFQRMFRNG